MVIQCCDSSDMCNKDLPLELPTKPPGRSDVEVVLSMCPANYCTLASCCWHFDARAHHTKRLAPKFDLRISEGLWYLLPWYMVRDCMAKRFNFSLFLYNQVFSLDRHWSPSRALHILYYTNVVICGPRCWDQENIFPPGDQPIWCREHELPDNITCCATDYCNRELFTGTVFIRMYRQGALSG